MWSIIVINSNYLIIILILLDLIGGIFMLVMLDFHITYTSISVTFIHWFMTKNSLVVF